MKPEYDVIVIGGGTAGTIAAIQAARAGASTLLVEKNAMLGGTMTVGGVNAPAHFFAWGQQVIAGIGWELLCKTYAEAALLPEKSQFLLVAGRCLAAEREANSALRVECPCMAMGQAAGAMAALSARTGRDPEDVPIDDIHCLLRKHRAIVPGDI
ncbi:MAG: FAD-dependent oxidoreductase [Planctomycetota bacterium]